MTSLPEEFAFLGQPDLDVETKKLLLTGLLEEQRHKRDLKLKAEEAKASQDLERRKLWHNTPLMLALVGTISVFANGLVSYIQAARTASDTITLAQLTAQLKESESRSQAVREQQLSQLKQELTQQAADAEARRLATKDEREFAFKIIERELAKSGDSGSRAEVLLFLVRAGILNSLDRVELTKMAERQAERAGLRPADVGIPPTLGLSVRACGSDGASVGLSTIRMPTESNMADRVIAAMQRKGYAVDRGPDEINIVYVEGMDPDGTRNTNDPNKWNDLRLTIRFKDEKPEIIGSWAATTEPGRFFTDNPINPKGAARIDFGQYKAWQVGMHRGDQEALVQTRPVTVCRDQNKDGLRIGDEVDTGLFGLNQHEGYNQAQADKLAGSLVGQSTVGHGEFMTIVKSDRRYRLDRSYIFTTTILPALDVLNGEQGR
jgi:hypothetical protein